MIEKEHDEYGDEYYVYLQNPKTNEQFDDYLKNADLVMGRKKLYEFLNNLH